MNAIAQEESKISSHHQVYPPHQSSTFFLDWVFLKKFKIFQASPLTENNIGSVGLVTPRIYWSCKSFTHLQIFPKRKKKKYCIKFTDNINFLSILSSFISKTFEDILEGKLVNKNVPKCLLAL